MNDERLAKLEDLLVDNKMPYPEYSILKLKYEKTKFNLDIELNQLRGSNLDLEKKVEKAVKDISRLSNLYETYETNDKSMLVGSIFPEMLSFDGKKCRTTRINEVIRLTLNLDKGLGKNKTG
jgi:site-specific DNA recombinase